MKLLGVFISISLIIFSCTKDNEVTSNLIYSNSFENHAMVSDWTNAWLSGDVYKDGGDSCLCVSGGCIIRPTQYTYGPVKDTLKFGIRFWAKSGNGGGFVQIRNDTLQNSYYLFRIENPEWKLYETDSVLTCPAKGLIRLSLVAGGIAGGTILVDNLEIYRKE